MRAKKQVLYVTDRNDASKVYLIRYPVFNNKFFGLYIHRFLLSDQEDPHDHPFHFLSYVVSGNYYEKRYQIKPWYSPDSTWADLFESGSAWRKEGTIAFRKNKDAHIVTLGEEIHSPDQYQKGVMTIILRSPRFREWGFWVNAKNGNMKKWICHQEYLPETRQGYKTPETLGK